MKPSNHGTGDKRHADPLGAYRLGKYLHFDWKRVIERLHAGGIDGASIGVPAAPRVGSRRGPSSGSNWFWGSLSADFRELKLL
jgi:hypothetical protein